MLREVWHIVTPPVPSVTNVFRFFFRDCDEEKALCNCSTTIVFVIIGHHNTLFVPDHSSALYSTPKLHLLLADIFSLYLSCSHDCNKSVWYLLWCIQYCIDFITIIVVVVQYGKKKTTLWNCWWRLCVTAEVLMWQRSGLNCTTRAFKMIYLQIKLKEYLKDCLLIGGICCSVSMFVD